MPYEGSARPRFDGQVAESAVVAQGDAYRQRDQRTDRDRLERKMQMLAKAGGDAIRAVPVRRVGQPYEHPVKKIHGLSGPRPRHGQPFYDRERQVGRQRKCDA